jgi:YegS/Rv2252/BmrU family lipid kinase
MPIPYKKIHIIINPASGKDEPILNVINRVFRQYDIDWELSITRASGDATRFAREAAQAGVDLVASYGGDGTQMEVADGLMGTGVPMAILPGGTGNSMAHDLKVPPKLKGAVELACTSPNLRAIDVAQVADQHFMLRANTGTSEQEKASRESKDRYGNFAYIMEGVRFLGHLPSARFHLTIDGQEFEQEGISCLIFNAGSMSYYANLSASIQVDDGLLNVFVVNKKIESMLSLASQSSLPSANHAEQHSWQGREITIDADPPQPLWLDGEHYGETPVTIKVVPKAIKVVVP